MSIHNFETSTFENSKRVVLSCQRKGLIPKNLNEVDRSMLENIVAEMNKENKKPSYISHVISSIKRFSNNPALKDITPSTLGVRVKKGRTLEKVATIVRNFEALVKDACAIIKSYNDSLSLTPNTLVSIGIFITFSTNLRPAELVKLTVAHLQRIDNNEKIDVPTKQHKGENLIYIMNRKLWDLLKIPLIISIVISNINYKGNVMTQTEILDKYQHLFAILSEWISKGKNMKDIPEEILKLKLIPVSINELNRQLVLFYTHVTGQTPSTSLGFTRIRSLSSTMLQQNGNHAEAKLFQRHSNMSSTLCYDKGGVKDIAEAIEDSDISLSDNESETKVYNIG